MGFRCASINMDKLAESLGMEVTDLKSKVRSARNGGYARLWNFEDKGTFGSGRLSISARRDPNSAYETQFQDGFVCFSGGAYEKAKELVIGEQGISIIILSCDVRNKWDNKTKKLYTNYYIYDFDIPEGSDESANNQTTNTGKSTATKKSTKKPEPNTDANDDADDDLPF